jgi:NAD-dependent deacetylase
VSSPGELAELIRGHQPCVVLTGAGASTESGIPDFRSTEGIWSTYDPYEVASIAGFRRNPERAWEFYGRRLGVLEEAEPNAVHLALAELELPIPQCADCGAVLKPDVVMFGELLPADAIDRADALARQARLLVVVGSSLEVWPVAGLPAATLAHGGRLAIVNRDPTPYDDRAAVVLRGSAGEALTACLARL